jgi:hypothetical protein
MGLFKPKRQIGQTMADVMDEHMRGIRGLFPGAKLTLIVRSDRFEKPIIMTNDTQAEAIKAMQEMVPGAGGVIVRGN